MMVRFCVAIVAMAICIGCGETRHASLEPQGSIAYDDVRYSTVDAPATEAMLASIAPSKPSDTTLHRKIIYEATLSLVVNDFSKAEQAILDLVKSHGGYLSSANVSRHQGSERSGDWTARIPVDSFDAFLDATTNLGVPERRKQTGQDVTEEFVDLEARIASKKKLEERILELLDDNKGEIKDVIEVERELERVRTEIEQMEGRLRYLQDRTSLTTVTIHAREEKDYTPPQAPKFGGRIAASWNSSTAMLGAAAEGLLLFVVACIPWALIASVVVVPIWWWRRGA